jgi:CxxC-x17-CxxC domain-containing protein
MYEVTCEACKSKCEVPFKPTAGKPVLCEDCFSESKKPVSYKEDFEALNKKLDKALRILELIHPKKTHLIEKPAVEAAQAEADDEESLVGKKPRKKAAKKTTAKKKVAAKKTTKKSTSKKPASKKKSTRKKNLRR